jgi:hypothetical protein
MKNELFCLSIALGLLSAQAQAGTVTLTSADVASALDINEAIQNATAGGTEPGIVILDGSAGAFEYTNGDRSINIGVSDLTIRGINLARIVNCDDGLFFDAVPVSNILIEGLVFQCRGDGIDAGFGSGPRDGVTVRRNVFSSSGVPGQGSTGIVIADGFDWRIANNIIIGGSGAAQSAVVLIGGAETTVINNLLVGFLGVALVFDPVAVTPPTEHRIVENRIEALQTGIRLDDAAIENRVVANRICVQTAPGPAIFLGADTSNNRVHGNQAALVSGDNLVVVEDLGMGNKISGNTQRRRC